VTLAVLLDDLIILGIAAAGALQVLPATVGNRRAALAIAGSAVAATLAALLVGL
jgi:hypothetical protein